MTNPDQPEKQQPEAEEPEVHEGGAGQSASAHPEAAQAKAAQAKAAQAEPESFGAHVERLVAEGKLTAAEAAELLDPVEAAPSTQQPSAEQSNQQTVQLAKEAAFDQSQTASGQPAAGTVPPDLRLEVEGYSLQVVHDPSLSAPRLTASKSGVLELRAGPAGWSIERAQHGLFWGLKAVLSLPFVARDVQAEVSGGNLTLASISGQARLEVSGGNATLGTSGSLRAEVSGGNLSAGAVTGSLELEVNGGNLSVAHSAALRAEVNGGQLSWAGRLGSGKHSLEVNGGQATLRLDAESSVTVEAESTLGGVSASFPLQKSGGMMHSTYSGVLGGGEARLRCEVNAGQIRLVSS
jgi:hypothetical protein